MSRANEILNQLVEAKIKRSDLKFLVDFVVSGTPKREEIEIESLDREEILSLAKKHFSKTYENFFIVGKPIIGTNGDHVEMQIDANWKGETDKVAIIAKVRIKRMLDEIIKALS
jgi:hypothetical protein